MDRSTFEGVESDVRPIRKHFYRRMGPKGFQKADVLASFLIAVCDGLLIQSFLDPERAPDADQLEGALGRGLAAALAQ